MYRVRFWQGGLPFDCTKALIPDDGKRSAVTFMLEGKPVAQDPLYTDERAALAKRKIDRLARSAVALKKQTEEEIEGEEQAKEDFEEVNLSSWLRGQVQYPAFKIFAAVKQRHHQNFNTLRAVVDSLVMDMRLVPEAEVAPHLMRLLDAPGEKAA